MAGEWIKFEAATPEKPEVFAITAAMGWDDPDLTVGKLLKIWRWFDQQTLDGDARSVTLALLDRIAGVTGFAQAMVGAGWLVQYEGGVCLPHFAAHNGATAKSRAQTAKRMARLRAGDAAGDAASVTPASPKEEKRKEKKTKFNARAALAELGVSDQLAEAWLEVRRVKRLPLTAPALDKVAKEAALAGIALDAALLKCCEQGWAGFMAKWVEDDPDVKPAVKDWE